MPRSLWILTVLGSLSILFGACTPKYPKCDNDEHCKAKGEYCVNGMCQQCRDDKNCEKGQQCKAGRCEAIPGYCESKDECPPGQVCKANRCSPCANDAECGEGLKCNNGKCVSCITDSDCPENNECQNGVCVAPPPKAVQGPCQPAAVFFDYNESVLTSKATAALRDAAKCIKSVADRKMRVEGHCDPRGTEEYNLALGDRRARSVKKYLRRLGVKKRKMRSVSKGKLEATGSDEGSWAEDRKAKFIWE